MKASIYYIPINADSQRKRQERCKRRVPGTTCGCLGCQLPDSAGQLPQLVSNEARLRFEEERHCFYSAPFSPFLLLLPHCLLLKAHSSILQLHPRHRPKGLPGPHRRILICIYLFSRFFSLFWFGLGFKCGRSSIMFYSHEILSNTQYGVATIWYIYIFSFFLYPKAAVDFFPRLVATVGKTTQKKLTRKAIQEVNVPKACETIIHPGAPLALRLQGNLLYGVSRVFAQQCRYVLSDAEKTQSDMMAFFRVMQTNETDPRAGKARRQQITLQDDPDFDPLTSLPNLDLLSNANDLVFLSTQISTQNNTSQMTPSTKGTSYSGRDHSLMGIDLPQSSHSAASYRLPSDLHQDSPFTKPFDPHGHLSQLNPFDEADLDAIPGIDLNFDADGNLIGFGEPEPELPPLPGSGAYEGQMHIKTANVAKLGVQKEQIENDNMVVMGEDALPDAEPFPKRPAARTTSSAVPTSETVETEEARAPARRGRPRKLCRMIDHRNDVPAAEFRSWSIDYLANMDANRKPAPTTTLTQARKNAKVFLFDNGLADVG
ncbi:hypothetical protein NM208_g13961 [Fusarium decemcellulare]|uniref:Uncharacterized protein n=1 Tax=Fusarium decemcellulare TaxID=57161 RepID=A0ACC1RJP7_9HYPO|nr:hypothetical protein NM208_g13961 [Fusarium decemcellulare]